VVAVVTVVVGASVVVGEVVGELVGELLSVADALALAEPVLPPELASSVVPGPGPVEGGLVMLVEPPADAVLVPSSSPQARSSVQVRRPSEGQDRRSIVGECTPMGGARETCENSRVAGGGWGSRATGRPRFFRYCGRMMAMDFRACVTAVGLVATGLGGCYDGGGRGDSQGATSNASVTLTGISAGATSVSEPTDSGTAGLTGTAGTGTGAASASTTGAADSTGGGVKFDLGEQPSLDFGGEDTGPIIPTTCAEAASGKSTVGCKFFAVDMDAHDGVENSQYAVGVANVQLAEMATVTVEVKEGGVWQVIGGPQAIGPLQLHTFNLPGRNTDDSALRAGGAYRVSSDVPVVAYQFNPVDGANSFLSDAAMLYPVAALDTVNHVTAWKSMMDNSNTFQHSYATVVATVDGTMVKVDPSVVTAAGPGVPAGAPGAPFTLPMQEGDVLSVAVQKIPDSMTGTKITSNDEHPIAVFAGQECALIPENVCCCDHMEEQLAGVRLWGKNFIAARMPVRNPGNPEATLWQIYAAEDATSVTITADPAVTGIPSKQFVLNQGQVTEMYVSGPPGQVGDFEISADKPIAVYGYMVGSENFGSDIGDPAMVAMAPTEQYLPRYVVLVPGTWINDFAVLTRPAGAQILLDGVAIPDASFIPVAATGYEVARVPVPDGVHVLDGGLEPFSVVIVGYDSWDSYAYLGGTGTGKINPNPPG